MIISLTSIKPTLIINGSSYFYILLIIMYFIILGSIRYIILISGIIIVPRPTFENEVVDDSDVREVGEWRDPKCMYFPKN